MRLTGILPLQAVRREKHQTPMARHPKPQGPIDTGRAAPPTHPKDRALGPGVMLAVAVLGIVVALVLLGLSGRSIPIPGFVVSRIEGRANAALDGQASLTIGNADLVVGQDFVPQVRWRNVTLRSAGGKELAQISRLRTALNGAALLRGQVQPLRLTVDGARIAMRRYSDGSLDIAPAAKALPGKAMQPADMLAAVKRAFALPALSGIETISVENLDVLWDDARSKQVWNVHQGMLRLDQDADKISVAVSFDLNGQTQLQAAPERNTTADRANVGAVPLARTNLMLIAQKASEEASLEVRVDDVSARDLAAQSPALAWLGALDAPISGVFKSGISPQGHLEPLNADLEIGAGALRPNADTRPVAFDRAHVGLTFDPATAALTLKELRVQSAALQAEASGNARITAFEDGTPKAIIGQIQIGNLKADPEGIFADAVTFSQGALDIKLELVPFNLTIGQFVLVDRGRKISAKGNVSANPEGWAVAFDVAIDAIETGQLLSLWPVSAVPNTRKWLADNVATGELVDVKAALRLYPGQEPRLALGYQFRGAEVKFLKTLPPISDGSGYATIEDYSYTLVIDKGRVHAPQGGDLDVAGSVVKVPDIRVIPANAEITLKSKSTITAALAILDEPPFRFLTKAGQKVDIAEGQAEVVADLKLKLVKNLKTEDISYGVTGKLTHMRSDTIVKNRTLSAEVLSVVADPAHLEISGDAALDSVPVSGTWRQAFGPEGKAKSRVEGKLELSPATLKAFAITLPDGAVSGKGWGRFTLDLLRDQPANFHLESDLAGLELRIPEVVWTKPASQKGSLVIAGALATPTRIDRLELDAAGLQAKGKLVLAADGSFESAIFPGAALGDWFSGNVTLTGRGKGKSVALAIDGGQADLRRSRFGKASAKAADSAPMAIALDQLQISDGIRLNGFSGQFSTNGGFSGDFTASVNAKAPIRGAVATAGNGHSAFRIEADDAGQTLAAAGIYESGREGSLSLILQPRDQTGTYDGTLKITNIRVVNAPGLAGLLNAISVVGLINQLQGAGIVFSDVTGKFLLTSDAIEIQEGSAIGASLGVSAAGVFRMADQALDLQGVISPIYLVNGIGQIFSRQRDGLFGFNYTLSGTKDATKVSVNPLSILTPGMFRNLFRKAPPTIEK